MNAPRMLTQALLRGVSAVHLRRPTVIAALVLVLLYFVVLPGLEKSLRPWPLSGNTERRCLRQPQQSVVCFLKTHKCASSSVQNVMMRYGESHNLSFVLPKKHNYLGHPLLFNRSIAPGKPPFDMLVHHARFQETEMRAVLRPRPRFVTIVREPASLFESLYAYYGLQKRSGMSLEKFVDTSVVNSSTRGMLARAWTHSKIGFNQMSYDLGLEPTEFGNATAVRLFIEQLDSAFDLVMVAERMDESLVLLKDLLCWETDDVVLFRLNARQSEYRSPLSPQLADKIRLLNGADSLLYEHFAQRFDLQVREFGEQRMAEELKLLRERTKYWYDRCVIDVHRPEKNKRTAGQKFWISYRVVVLRAKNESAEECARMSMPELEYTERLRQRQFGSATSLQA